MTEAERIHQILMAQAQACDDVRAYGAGYTRITRDGEGRLLVERLDPLTVRVLNMPSTADDVKIT